MNDIVVVAVLKSEDDLPDVVTADRLAVDETGRGAFDDLEAQVGAGHEFEHHVQHSLGTKMIKICLVVIQNLVLSSLSQLQNQWKNALLYNNI